MIFKTVLLAATASLAMTSAVLAQSSGAELKAHSLPAEIAYPEGIAHDPRTGVFYTAGAGDGAVARVDPRTGQATIITKAGVLVPAGAAFPAILGMKLDETDRLWISGGVTGKLHVVDAKTGQLVKTLSTPAEPRGLINDVTLTADAAYFSDSFRPVVWKVSRAGGQVGEAEAWLDLSKGPIAYGQGANINGIASTPDGKTLLLVQMNTGLLYRADVAGKTVSAVDLKGALLSGADGLVLDGRRLYAVLQPTGKVVAIDLAADLSSGVVAGELQNAALIAPATAAKVGDELWVMNTQFNKRSGDTAARPFTASIVPIAAIAAN
jgi:Cu-Zn family superoxide dismutase